MSILGYPSAAFRAMHIPIAIMHEYSSKTPTKEFQEAAFRETAGFSFSLDDSNLENLRGKAGTPERLKACISPSARPVKLATHFEV